MAVVMRWSSVLYSLCLVSTPNKIETFSHNILKQNVKNTRDTSSLSFNFDIVQKTCDCQDSSSMLLCH